MVHQAIVEIPSDKIDCFDSMRERINEFDLERIATSIDINGQLHPPRLLARGDGRYDVLTGNLRVLAQQKKLGAKTIAVIVHDKPLTEAEQVKIKLCENCERVNFNPMEEAKAVDRFMRASGLNSTETARELNMSDADVSRCRERIREWSEELQQLVGSGKIRAATGHQIHKIADPGKRQELIALASEGRLTRAAAVGFVKQEKSRPRRSKARKQQTIRVQIDGVTLVMSAAELGTERVVSVAQHVADVGRDVLAKGLGMDALSEALKVRP